MNDNDATQYRDLAESYSELAQSADATGAPDVALFWRARAHVARTQAERAARPEPRPACFHGVRPASARGTCRAMFGGGR